MGPESRQLKHLSQLVTEIHSFLKPPKQGSRKFVWLRVVGFVIAVIGVLSAPLIVAQFRKNEPLPLKGEQTLGVERLVRQIQIEIAKSEEDRKAEGIAPMFELRSFELEISFVVKNTSTQTGKANFEIVTVDNQFQAGSEQTHRLKLVMDVLPLEGEAEQSTSQPPENGQILNPIPPVKAERVTRQ